MTNEVNFDELAAKAFAAGATTDDYEKLFAAAFANSKWHFIAESGFPKVAAYCAIFPGFFENKPMVAAFTDTEKLREYAKEKNIVGGTAKDPIILASTDVQAKFSSDNLIFSVAPETFLDYIGKLLEYGVQGIFFNPNKFSQGFFNSLQKLRPIKEHLESKNMLSKGDAEPTETEKIASPAVEKKAEISNPANDQIKPSGAVNFDALSRQANESGGASEALNNLFGSTYALPKWLFIARGELPNVNPYVASNADYADGQQMIRAFTDTNRLHRFAKENNLTDASGSAQMLDIPTDNIIDYLEGFMQNGVHGIWFNSDIQSDGFFIPLKQLRPIKEHLASINWKSINEPTDSTLPHNSGFVPPVTSQKSDKKNTSLETAIVLMQDGLMSPANVFTPSARRYTCFCRIPADWTSGSQIKSFVMEKFFEIVFRDKWNTQKPIDGSRFIVPKPQSKVLTPEEVQTFDWNNLYKTAIGDELFLFFIANENGALREVTETDFRAQIDSTVQKTLEHFDGYINWFRRGKIKSDATFKPFFRAIAPLLENYSGAGEFSFTFATGMDEPNMKDLFEDVTRNSNGAYLKYRSYVFQRSTAEPTYDMQIIGSNILTNVQTGEKLLVQLTMHKKLEVDETTLIVRFLGSGTEVEKLGNAVQPALDECEFTGQLESKRPPSIDALKEIGG